MRLFRYFSPVEGGSGAGATGDSQGAGAKEGSPNAEGSGSTSNVPGQNKTKEQLEAENRWVTRELFQGHSAAQKREFKELLAQSNADIKQQIEALQKALEGTVTPKGKSETPDNPKADAVLQIEDLRKENKKLSDTLKGMQDTLDTERKKARDQRFETVVKDALVRQKCLYPDKVFRMIAPDLRFSEDGTRVLATLKSEGSDIDVEVADFVKRVTLEELPQLFEGGVRPGSPAGGDAGKAGKYLYTLSQLTKNPDLYINQGDKVRQAFQEGQVDLKH
jgi:hypothetical protein